MSDPARPRSDAMLAAARLLRGATSDLNTRAWVVGVVAAQPGGLAAVEAAEADIMAVIAWLEIEACK